MILHILDNMLSSIRICTPCICYIVDEMEVKNKLVFASVLSGGAKDAGYWAVINFQLSNALYEEMGWIVHPTSKEDPERETILEWATQRLQLSIKQK